MNIDAYNENRLNKYLDSQDVTKDYKGDTLEKTNIYEYEDEYFNVDDAEDFLEHLGLSNIDLVENDGIRNLLVANDLATNLEDYDKSYENVSEDDDISSEELATDLIEEGDFTAIMLLTALGANKI